MKTELIYFDVIYGKKITFACLYENTALEWIDSIRVAKEYAQQIDQQIKESF